MEKNNIAVFQSAIAEIVEVPQLDNFKHPFLTLAKFIFADDKGNQNNQGIEFEDFEEVSHSAIDTPVKMNFTGAGVGNHLGSYVVGHIKDMEKVEAGGVNQLIATAILYSDEFPEEIKYLKDSFASGEAPGISYELAYQESKLKNGIQWLKKMFTLASTFVRAPAYGKRTAILALASAKDDDEFIQTMKTLVAQAEEKSGEGKIINPTGKGGKNVEELEKAKADAEKFRAEADTRTVEVARLTEQLEAKTGEISTLTEKVATLEREKMLEARIRKYTEAGFQLEAEAEKVDKRKTFWLSLSDEAFEEYLADLVAATKVTESHRALASLNVGIPRPTDSDNKIISFNFRD